MRITITADDSNEPEVYESLDALVNIGLAENASEDYTDKVLARLKAGETHFTVANGPSHSDTYDVTEED